jgi:hypothetical protein
VEKNSMQGEIDYALEPDLTLDEFVAVLER